MTSAAMGPGDKPQGCGEWIHDAPGAEDWKCGRVIRGEVELCAYCQRDSRHPAPHEAVDALIEAGSFLSESVSRLAGDIDCRCGPDGVCDDHERIRAWWIALARCKAATEGEG